jgi:hypothetical protein
MSSPFPLWQERELKATWVLYLDELIGGVRLAADDPRPPMGVFMCGDWCVGATWAHYLSLYVCCCSHCTHAGPVHGLSQFAARSALRAMALHKGARVVRVRYVCVCALCARTGGGEGCA